MSDRGIEKEIETAMINRITEILAKNEEYRQSVEEEQKLFDWLKENLEGEPLEKLDEYFLCRQQYGILHRKVKLSSGYEGLASFL